MCSHIINKIVDISVVIPAYNEQRYIKHCVESVKKQASSFAYEIIVVDNNSTDNTVITAQKTGVKVIKETRQGVGVARRAGTEQACGKYIIHLDADSIVSTNFFEQVVGFFAKDDKLACIGGQYVFYDAPWWKNLLRIPLFYILLYSARLFSLGRIGPMGGCMAFRKNTYNKTNGFDASLKFGEDSDLCRQLSRFGKIKVYPKLKCFVSSRRFKINFKLFILFWQYLKMVFNKKSNYEFPHSQKL